MLLYTHMNTETNTIVGFWGATIQQILFKASASRFVPIPCALQASSTLCLVFPLCVCPSCQGFLNDDVITTNMGLAWNTS